MAINDDKKRPAALNLQPVRSSSTDSSSSTSSIGKPPRTPRFAEATSIHSPVESTGNGFGDRNVVPQSQPGDIGFGYISNNRESAAVPMSPRSPLKSAMKAPGTPGRGLNPLSPTFREEQILEKREESTEKEQVKDLVMCLCPNSGAGRRANSFDRKSRPVCGSQRWPCGASTSAVV